MFTLDREQLKHPRVEYIDDLIPISLYLNQIETAIQNCYHNSDGFQAVQHGRVIALRATDFDRMSSAFKAGLYLGKYNDMGNTQRFLSKMVSAGHSYEPIRGENVLFLYLGVGKPVYDHLTTYTVGRPTRIAGGQRANLPWGFEVPAEIKGDVTPFAIAGNEAVRYVVNTTKGLDEKLGRQQIQAARSILPVGYIMPPFLLEFTEEALVKSVLTQRLWESGAQGATVDIVSDMWECLKLIDEEKWEKLLDHHGPHIQRWEKVMRTLRDKEVTMNQFLVAARTHLALPDASVENFDKLTAEELNENYHTLMSTNLHDLLVQMFGKLPPNMWEKQQ